MSDSVPFYKEDRPDRPRHTYDEEYRARYNQDAIYGGIKIPDKISSWDDFSQSLDQIKNAKEKMRMAKRMERLDPEFRAPRDFYSTYDPDSSRKLAEIVGNKNFGIAFHPDWNSFPTAEK
jgi:hypothetical protein